MVAILQSHHAEFANLEPSVHLVINPDTVEVVSEPFTLQLAR